MFTYFTDRDGKYQLASLAESGFDPLSRTCRFMLTEEAHHCSSARPASGASCSARASSCATARPTTCGGCGGLDLHTVQKYLNFHYSVSLDLFGSEISTNAANFYTMGLKGRFEESKKHDDHRLKDATYTVERAGRRPHHDAARRRRCRHSTSACATTTSSTASAVLDRWNQIIKRHEIDLELRLPHRGFHRAIGLFAEVKVAPDGRVVSEAEWDARKHEWLPTEADQAYVDSLMQPVTERRPFRQLDRAAGPRRQRPARRLRVRSPGLGHERVGAAARAVQRRDVVRRPQRRRRPRSRAGVPPRRPHAHLRGRPRAGQSNGERAARDRRRAREPRAHALPGRARVHRHVLGRHQDRRGPDSHEHADAHGGLSVFPERQPRQGGRRVGAAPGRSRAGARRGEIPQARAGRGRRPRTVHGLRGTDREGVGDARRGGDLARRSRVLAVFVGLDRLSRRAPCTCSTTW